MTTTSRKELTALEMTTRDFDILPNSTSLPQPPFKSIYSLLLIDCHIILSIYNKTLRPFPRFLRTTLLFTLLYVQTFLSCLAASLWERSNSDLFYQIILALWVVSISEGIITVLGNFNRVSRKGIKTAKNTEEFVRITRKIENKMKILWFIIIFLCALIFIVSSTYLVIFFSFAGYSCKISALQIFIFTLIIDFILYEPFLALILSIIKWKGFEIKFLHKLDAFIYKLRIWKAINPDYV